MLPCVYVERARCSLPVFAWVIVPVSAIVFPWVVVVLPVSLPVVVTALFVSFANVSVSNAVVFPVASLPPVVDVEPLTPVVPPSVFKVFRVSVSVMFGVIVSVIVSVRS